VRVLAAFACALLGLAVSAPAAFGVMIGANDSGQSPLPLPAGKYPTHTIVTGGMPGWQLAVIVTVAILVVSIIAVVVHRVRDAQRNRIVPAT
jgi:hypothetical protein